MTSKEFVLWLKGFTQGIEEYSITPTPTQWNVIKDRLAEVNDGQPNPIGVGGFAVTATPEYGSITYGYPSGSAWHYTSTQKEPTPPTSEKQLLTENHD
jgi:hypothetical protein